MITAHTDAPEGSVLTLSNYAHRDFPHDAAVLCRNTAPLVGLAFDLLRHSVPCHIVGKDIQVGLEKLLDRVAVAGNKNETQIRLMAHEEKETEKLIRKGKKREAENLSDRCRCLSMFIDRTVGGLTDVARAITSLFANGNGVTLCTVHKAKGLEWDTVFILDWHLCPSRWAEADWEKVQERNIQYVAVTRAKTHLRFITTGGMT